MDASTASTKSRVGMWAEHVNGQLDPRLVVRDEGYVIWIDILGREVGPLPAEHYTYLGRASA
jgi:hypothetical protein